VFGIVFGRFARFGNCLGERCGEGGILEGSMCRPAPYSWDLTATAGAVSWTANQY
jgi:hypothetical protein